MALIPSQLNNPEHLNPRYSYMAQALRGVYLPSENQEDPSDIHDHPSHLEILDLITKLSGSQYLLMADIITATHKKGGLYERY